MTSNNFMQPDPRKKGSGDGDRLSGIGYKGAYSTRARLDREEDFVSFTTSTNIFFYQVVGGTPLPYRTNPKLFPLPSDDPNLEERQLGGNDLSNAKVIATGGVTPRSIADHVGDTLNVKDFGAKGDGVTDDTAAIQAALQSGKLVEFAEGVYNVSSTLNVPERIIIDLGNAKIKGVDGIQQDYLHQAIFRIETEDVHIKNGTVEMFGEEFPDGPLGERGLVSHFHMRNANRVLIENVNLDGGCNRSWAGFVVVGVIDVETSTHVHVDKCYYNGHYRTGDAHDAVTLGYKPYTECVYIDSVSEYVTCSNNFFENCNYSGVAISSGDNFHKYHNVYANTIERTSGSCISFNTSGSAAHGNVLTQSYDNSGIVVGHENGNTNNNTVQGNIIKDMWFNAITTPNTSYNNAIQGNTIQGCNQAGAVGDVGAAIRVRGLRHIVNGNSIITTSGDIAVSVRSPDKATRYEYVNNTVSNNSINGGYVTLNAPFTCVSNNSFNSGTMAQAVLVGFRCEHSKIVNNTAYNIDRCVGVGADASDPADYVGITVFGNTGGTIEAESTNVPVNQIKTFARNMEFQYPLTATTQGTVGFELNGLTKDTSGGNVPTACGALRNLCLDAAGTEYGWELESSFLIGGDIGTFTVMATNQDGIEIKARPTSGGAVRDSKVFLHASDTGLRYSLKIVGGALVVTQE